MKASRVRSAKSKRSERSSDLAKTAPGHPKTAPGHPPKKIAWGWLWGSILAVGCIALFIRTVALREQPAGEDGSDQTTKSIPAKTDIPIPERPESLLALDQSGNVSDRVRILAIEIAEQTAKVHRRNSLAACLLAKTHLRSRGEIAAQALWAHALELDPSCLEAMIDLGHYHSQKGEFAEAVEWAQRAYGIAPRNIEVVRLLYDCWVADGNHEAASQLLETKLKIDPNNAEDWFRLAKSQLSLERYESAANSCLEALRLQPNTRPVLQTMLTVQRRLGNDELVKKYVALLEQQEREFSPKADGRGKESADQKRMEDFLEYVAITASEIHNASGDMRLGAAVIEKASIELPQSIPLAERRVHELVRNGELDAAIRVFQENCSHHPDRHDRWLGLGVLALKSRRYEAAEEAFLRCIELVPDDATAYAYLAQCNMPENRNRQMAVHYAKKAAELQPSADHYFVLANAHFYHRDRLAAQEALSKALAKDPRNPEFIQALEHLQQSER